MWYNNLKFKKKVLISFVIISLVPMIILGTYSYMQTMRLIRERSSGALVDYANETAFNLNAKLTRYKSIMELVVRNPNLQNYLSVEEYGTPENRERLLLFVKPLFETALRTNSDIFAMTVFNRGNNDEYGNIIANFDLIKDEPWVEDVINRKFVKWYCVDGKLLAACSLNDYYGDKNLGVVVMWLNTNLVFKEILYGRKEDYGVKILDSRGGLVLDKPIGREAEGSALYSQSATVGISDWEVIVTISQKKFFEERRSILFINYSVIFICFTVLILIVIFLSDILVKRIYNLNENVKAVSSATPDFVFDSDYADEIGELTKNIGGMLKEKQRLTAEIYQGEIKQREAELKVLQAQINPHFLYNVLSIINCMALQRDEYEISRITNIISKFYRSTLNNGEDILAVGDEIENVKTYLGIILVKLYDSFDVVWELESEIYRHKMIKLLIQPIVENAIEHGVKNLTNRKGKITISGKLSGGYLYFIVRDNGVGMDSEMAENIVKKDSKGYGVKNVNERIKLRYGEECGVFIESQQGEGTTVTLKIKPI